MRYRFYVTGPIMPAVRMTKKSKFVSQRAQEYLACKERIQYSIKQQMINNGLEMLPDRTPLGIHLVFSLANGLHKQDWDNLAKTVQDAMQGIVFSNDLWVDEAYVIKRLDTEHSSCVWITIETMGHADNNRRRSG